MIPVLMYVTALLLFAAGVALLLAAPTKIEPIEIEEEDE